MEERERGCVWLCSASLTLDEKQMRHHQKRCRGGWAGCPQAPTPGPCSALQRPLAPFPAPPPNLPASLSRSLGILPQGFQAHANFPPHAVTVWLGAIEICLVSPCQQRQRALLKSTTRKTASPLLFHLLLPSETQLESRTQSNSRNCTREPPTQFQLNPTHSIRPHFVSVLHQMHQPSRWRPDPDLESS